MSVTLSRKTLAAAFRWNSLSPFASNSATSGGGCGKSSSVTIDRPDASVLSNCIRIVFAASFSESVKSDT